MKTTRILTILFTSMAATAIASPNALPMGVEVVERDGKTIVREVPHVLLSRGLNPDAENVLAKVVNAPSAMAAAMSKTPNYTVLGAVTSADLVVFVRDRLASRHVFRTGQ